MSGIAGIVGGMDDLQQRLRRMLYEQRHRGKVAGSSYFAPFVDACIGLGCTGTMAGEATCNHGAPLSGARVVLGGGKDGHPFHWR